jgi:hypothetical protein
MIGMIVASPHGSMATSAGLRAREAIIIIE